MGKGSKQRPAQVPQAELEKAWERTFGKKKRTTPEPVRELTEDDCTCSGPYSDLDPPCPWHLA